MIVNDLIKRLEHLPWNARVVVVNSDEGYEITEVVYNKERNTVTLDWDGSFSNQGW